MFYVFMYYLKTNYYFWTVIPFYWFLCIDLINIFIFIETVSVFFKKLKTKKTINRLQNYYKKKKTLFLRFVLLSFNKLKIKTKIRYNLKFLQNPSYILTTLYLSNVYFLTGSTISNYFWDLATHHKKFFKTSKNIKIKKIKINKKFKSVKSFVQKIKNTSNTLYFLSLKKYRLFTKQYFKKKLRNRNWFFSKPYFFTNMNKKIKKLSKNKNQWFFFLFLFFKKIKKTNIKNKKLYYKTKKLIKITRTSCNFFPKTAVKKKLSLKKKKKTNYLLRFFFKNKFKIKKYSNTLIINKIVCRSIMTNKIKKLTKIIVKKHFFLPKGKNIQKLTVFLLKKKIKHLKRKKFRFLRYLRRKLLLSRFFLKKKKNLLRLHKKPFKYFFKLKKHIKIFNDFVKIKKFSLEYLYGKKLRLFYLLFTLKKIKRIRMLLDIKVEKIEWINEDNAFDKLKKYRQRKNFFLLFLKHYKKKIIRSFYLRVRFRKVIYLSFINNYKNNYKKKLTKFRLKFLRTLKFKPKFKINNKFQLSSIFKKLINKPSCRKSLKRLIKMSILPNIIKPFSYLNKKLKFPRFTYYSSFAKLILLIIVKKIKFFINFFTYRTGNTIENITHLSLISNNNYPFILTIVGFIFINFSFNKISVLSFLKKKNNSFITKHELHKLVLKRYLRFSVYTTNNNINKSLFFLKELCLSEPVTLLSLVNDSQKIDQNRKNILKFDYKFSSFIKDANMNISRIKFKPGYSTIWREARSILMTIFNKRFRYQHKITNYVSTLSSYARPKFYLFLELQLYNILLLSRLFFEKSIIDFFINNSSIFVNGWLCTNRLFQLHVNDIIQIVIHLKYYILSRWLYNLMLKKKKKLRKINKIKFQKKIDLDEKKKSRLLPNWILSEKHYLNDIPKYIETDYLTLSIFVIYEPFLINDLSFYHFFTSRPHIYRLYNWKYIT